VLKLEFSYYQYITKQDAYNKIANANIHNSVFKNSKISAINILEILKLYKNINNFELRELIEHLNVI